MHPPPATEAAVPVSATTHDPHKDSWYPYSNGPRFDSNIAMILIFIFCALICALALNAGIRFFLRLSREPPHRGRIQAQSPTDQKQAQSPPPALLLSLPTLLFSSGTKMKLAGEAAECAICLSEFVNGEAVRILPKCKHGFHVKCIEGWFSSHLSCPTCRTTCLTSSPPPPPPHISGDHYDVESPPPLPPQTPGGDH